MVLCESLSSLSLSRCRQCVGVCVFSGRYLAGIMALRLARFKETPRVNGKSAPDLAFSRQLGLFLRCSPRQNAISKFEEEYYSEIFSAMKQAKSARGACARVSVCPCERECDRLGCCDTGWLMVLLVQPAEGRPPRTPLTQTPATSPARQRATACTRGRIWPLPPPPCPPRPQAPAAPLSCHAV